MISKIELDKLMKEVDKTKKPKDYSVLPKYQNENRGYEAKDQSKEIIKILKNA